MTEKNNHIEDKTVRAYGEQALREEAQAILDQIPFLDENFEKAEIGRASCRERV